MSTKAGVNTAFGSSSRGPKAAGTSNPQDYADGSRTSEESGARGNRTAATNSVVTSASNISAATKRTLASYEDKHVLKKELQNAGKAALSKAEAALSSGDDLGAKAMTGLFESGKISVAAFKTSQSVVSVTPKAVRVGTAGIAATGKGIYQVGKQTALTTVAVVQAYSLCKGMNIMPVSKQGLRVLHATTVSSGLANTKISQAVSRGMDNIHKTVTRTVQTAKNIKTRITLTANGVKQTAQSAYVLTKGMVTGVLSFSFVAYRMEIFLKHNTARLLTKAAPYAKVGLETAIKGARWALPQGIKAARGGVMGTADALRGIDDYAVQGVIKTVQAADTVTRIGTQTVKTGTRLGKTVVKKTIKTVVNTGKGISFWASYIKANGWRKAWESASRRAGKKFLTALRNGGRSIVTAVINLVKALGTKIIIPLCVLLFVICGGFSAVMAPIMGVVSWVSGWFGTSDTEEEFEVSSFLADTTYGVPVLAAQSREMILETCTDSLKANGGTADMVRLYSDTAGSGSGAQIDIDSAAIATVFYTDAELIEILSPVFNAVVYMDYDGQPSLSQAKRVLADLYSKLFTFDTSTSTEYCGQNLYDGTGVANTKHVCGKIHSEMGCPNIETGYHTSRTCLKNSVYTDYICRGHDDGAGNITYCSTTSALTVACDNCTPQNHVVGCDYFRYSCGGYSQLTCSIPEHTHSCSSCCDKPGPHFIIHNWVCGKSEHRHSGGCYSTVYCNGGNEMDTACGHSPTAHEHCDGYAYCGGHTILSCKLEMGGIYALINEVFLGPIDHYASIQSRTEEEEEALQNLQDWYELFNVMMSEMSSGSFGGSLSVADLEEVEWVDSTRRGNDDIIALALSQVGNMGGQTYWSYAGFSYRVSWCACFVHWCMRNTASATGAWATTSNNYYCQTLANYYKDAGQFRTSYADIAAGDCIFFDWECDGHTDHIGLVIGRDSEYVYAVEGNSGDCVRIKKYGLNSSVIYGYAYMNY